jgi:hypothetical protein
MGGRNVNTRVPVHRHRIEAVVSELQKQIDKRIDKHGRDSFIGPHEIFGVLAEEVDEYLVEVRLEDHDKQVAELFDIAVAAVFGIASLRTNRAWTDEK